MSVFVKEKRTLSFSLMPISFQAAAAAAAAAEAERVAAEEAAEAARKAAEEAKAADVSCCILVVRKALCTGLGCQGC